MIDRTPENGSFQRPSPVEHRQSNIAAWSSGGIIPGDNRRPLIIRPSAICMRRAYIASHGSVEWFSISRPFSRHLTLPARTSLAQHELRTRESCFALPTRPSLTQKSINRPFGPSHALAFVSQMLSFPAVAACCSNVARPRMAT